MFESITLRSFLEWEQRKKLRQKLNSPFRPLARRQCRIWGSLLPVRWKLIFRKECENTVSTLFMKTGQRNRSTYCPIDRQIAATFDRVRRESLVEFPPENPSRTFSTKSQTWVLVTHVRSHIFCFPSATSIP